MKSAALESLTYVNPLVRESHPNRITRPLDDEGIVRAVIDFRLHENA